MHCCIGTRPWFLKSPLTSSLRRRPLTRCRRLVFEKNGCLGCSHKDASLAVPFEPQPLCGGLVRSHHRPTSLCKSLHHTVQHYGSNLLRPFPLRAEHVSLIVVVLQRPSAVVDHLAPRSFDEVRRYQHEASDRGSDRLDLALHRRQVCYGPS